jgi:hypothetical protein
MYKMDEIFSTDNQLVDQLNNDELNMLRGGAGSSSGAGCANGSGCKNGTNCAKGSKCKRGGDDISSIDPPITSAW